MNAFFTLLVVGVLLAFWGSLLAIVVAGAVYLWVVLLDELRDRRARRKAKRSLPEAEP
jgi:Flp pilus assembly protein TadB